MSITLDPDLEARLKVLAESKGVTPDLVANEVLRRVLKPVAAFVPRDEWETRLLSIPTDCGVSLPDEAFLAESLYD